MRGAKGGAGRKGIDHETQPAGLWPPTRANGQVAFGVYAIEPETGSYLPIALDVLTLRGDLISDVTAFRARCAILFGFLTAVFAETLTLRSLGDRRLRVTAAAGPASLTCRALIPTANSNPSLAGCCLRDQRPLLDGFRVSGRV
jgi:hypothetical protein